MKGTRTSYARSMEKFSAVVSDWTGSSGAFVLALGAIVVWLITGPLFHFSDSWLSSGVSSRRRNSTPASPNRNGRGAPASASVLWEKSSSPPAR